MVLESLLAVLSLAGPGRPTYGPPVSRTAAIWECKPVVWDPSPPVMVPLPAGDQFQGMLTTACMIDHTQGLGLPVLDQYILTLATAGGRVNEGPDEEIFEGLPSVHYDVTMAHDLEQGHAVIDSEVHVALDPRTRLTYQSTSKGIQGTGSAQYLRTFDLRVDVGPVGGAPGRYQLIFRNLVRVDRPRFAPAGIFFNTVEKSSREQFQARLAVYLPEFANRL